MAWSRDGCGKVHLLHLQEVLQRAALRGAVDARPGLLQTLASHHPPRGKQVGEVLAREGRVLAVGYGPAPPGGFWVGEAMMQGRFGIPGPGLSYQGVAETFDQPGVGGALHGASQTADAGSKKRGPLARPKYNPAWTVVTKPEVTRKLLVGLICLTEEDAIAFSPQDRADID